MNFFNNEKIIKNLIYTVAKRTHHEITLKELIKFVGGEKKFKNKFKFSEDAYQYLMLQQDNLVTKLLRSGYDEVGELNNTPIIDLCDDFFPSRG